MNHIIIRITLGSMFPSILLLIGILFLYLSRKIPNDRKDMEKKCTSRTKGVVTDIKEEEIGHELQERKRRYLWVPYITYTVQGNTYNEPLNGHEKDYFSIGEKIDVYYNPSNPTQIYAPKDNAADIIGRYYLPAGIVMIILSLFMIVAVHLICNIL